MQIEKKTNQTDTYSASENGYYGTAFIQSDSNWANISVTKSSAKEDNSPFRTIMTSMSKEEAIFVRDFLNQLPL